MPVRNSVYLNTKLWNMASYFHVRLIHLLVFLGPVLCLEAQIEYIEEKEDDYMPIPIEQRKSAPPYSFQTNFISTIQVNTDLNGLDILNDAANEPSIAVDPNNSNRIVIGWRQFANIESNFRQAGISYSIDRGNSWNFLEPIEKELFRSDPVLSTDKNGNFYYNSLSQDYSCDVFKSFTLDDWSNKTYAFGGDKQWMVIDKTNQASQGNMYAFWKSSFTDCPNGNFTRSIDQGSSYENCSLTPINITRGTLDIGPDGELYACGGISGQHAILKSNTAKDPESIVSWDLSTYVDLKGGQALYDGPNPAGMLGQVWVATDHSDTDSRGNVYLLSSVERSDNDDPADIMFSKSVDGGVTWSEAFRINNDNSTENWQWFGTMSVAPNGRIDVVWLDTREQENSFLSALYYAYSLDAGESWSANIPMSESFDPHVGFPSQSKIGDYFHMVSEDAGAHLAWAATFNGGQDIYYSYIPAEPDLTETSDLAYPIDIGFLVYPNPSKQDIQLDFDLKKSTTLSLRIVDLLGRSQFLKRQMHFSPGPNTMTIAQDDLKGFKSGMYYLQLIDQEGNTIGLSSIIRE